MKNKVKYLYQSLIFSKENRKAKDLMKLSFSKKVHRVYHFHIRKTGGTSINLGVIQHILKNNPQETYSKLSANRFNLRQIINDRVIIGWDVNLINKGLFHYGFSHKPFDQIQLPKNTFSFTCFRDPIKRVLSHYNMLCYYRKNNLRPELKSEIKHLGANLIEYLNSMPKKHTMNQLYMFSSKFDVQIALKNIANLDHVIFLGKNGHDLTLLNAKIGIEISPFHEKNYGHKETITDNEIAYLSKFLEPECTFYNKVFERYNS